MVYYIHVWKTCQFEPVLFLLAICKIHALNVGSGCFFPLKIDFRKFNLRFVCVRTVKGKISGSLESGRAEEREVRAACWCQNALLGAQEFVLSSSICWLQSTLNLLLVWWEIFTYINDTVSPRTLKTIEAVVQAGRERKQLEGEELCPGMG